MHTIKSPRKTLTRISIVIPAYNEARHIGACLDAVARQTVKPHQVIVVDNNSTDATAAIAKTYPFVRLIRESQQGPLFARNVGFNAARGDIIGRIDADTRLPADWIKEIIEFYAQPEHARSAFTGGVLCYNLRVPRAVSFIQEWIVFRLNWLFLGHYVLFGTNMALPTSLWHAVRDSTCTRTDIHEDLDLSIHLHHLGYEITYDPAIKVGAKMRRVRSERRKLWANLQWWPNTLRAHGIRTWPGAWLGGLILWLGSPVFSIMEFFARLVGKPPIKEA
ncbi:MAG TPA: glycosyltransferase family 2 protein [Patescibacteria group bacterium]|nr:glycosyltransferase family 2 protein [Patescibacteria group bacterium]